MFGRRNTNALSPEARAIVTQLGSPSRRNVLKGAGGLSLAAMLAACGTSQGSPAKSRPSAAADRSAAEKVVNWANWTLFLDYDDDAKSHPTLKQFQKKTGLKVKYSEEIDVAREYYTKFEPQMAEGKDFGRDIVTLTDFIAARMIANGYTQELDPANVPNAKNIRPVLKDVAFDKGRKHSLTWQSGFTGIGWNKLLLPKGLRTVSDLWKPELRGRVEVIDDMRDTMGLIMTDQGVDIAGGWGQAEFDKALEMLTKQVDSGQIRKLKGNTYVEDLSSGHAAAVICWSGDITQLNVEKGDQWEFAIPDAGGVLWSENLMIPIGSPHKRNAEKLINHYYDPKVAAEVAAYVNYVCPVEGAQTEMTKIDPKLAEDPLIFPDSDTLSKVKVVRTLSDGEQTKFSDAFEKVLNG